MSIGTPIPVFGPTWLKAPPMYVIPLEFAIALTDPLVTKVFGIKVCAEEEREQKKRNDTARDPAKDTKIFFKNNFIFTQPEIRTKDLQ